MQQTVLAWYRPPKTAGGVPDSFTIVMGRSSEASTATPTRRDVTAIWYANSAERSKIRSMLDPNEKIMYVGNYTVCGTPGYKITVVVGGQKGQVEMIHLIEHRGNSYVMRYTRSARESPDESLWKFMNTYCPGDAARMASLTVPAGWKAIPAPRIWEPLGIWRHQYQVLYLYRTVAEMPRSAALAQTEIESLQPRSQSSLLRVREDIVCDAPALFFESKAGQFGFEYVDETEMTTDGIHLYLAEYLRPNGQAERKDAITAMHSLCVMPTDGPEPTDSPAPSTMTRSLAPATS
jgi:hypothetical protein